MKEIKNKLKNHKKTKDPEIREELISFILKEELKLTTMFSSDSKLRPSTDDQYQETRDLLREIRITLKLI
tara:strand:+ start:224 stop:433 length:210 start_codon:yes stop_codon:yes gene_type:complete